MLHALVGLTVATILIIGWGYGNLFACVFLTIPITLGLLVFAVKTPAAPGWALTCMVLLAVIWLPRRMRLRAAAYPVYLPPPPRYPPLKIVMAGELAPFMKSLAAVLIITTAVTLILMPFFPL